MILMIFHIFMTPKMFFLNLFQVRRGPPFLKKSALPGNQVKSSYRVSVSLPGVGKIPVARYMLRLSYLRDLHLIRRFEAGTLGWVLNPRRFDAGCLFLHELMMTLSEPMV